MSDNGTAPLIAIACGGTGGHLYPGIAVAEEFRERGCDVLLLISQKEVDQQAIKSLRDVDIHTVPAVGLTRGRFLQFARSCWKSYRSTKKVFKKRRPAALLSMGGFTSAAPALAAKKLGAKIFLHDSNAIPGRANRWLAHVADEGFVYFHETSGRLYLQKIQTVGMPLRREFLEPADQSAARMVFGLDPEKPVLLVMGGSQGATGVNELVLSALPELQKLSPDLQFIHLTGPQDIDRVRAVYENAKVKAAIYPFLTEMELALGAATVVVSRAGASSLAEIAAAKVPSILIPYPHAADNHQHYNALGFVGAGAAVMFEQSGLTSERLAQEVSELEKDEAKRIRIKAALQGWYTPNAASKIVDHILIEIGKREVSRGADGTDGDCCSKKVNLEKAHV